MIKINKTDIKTIRNSGDYILKWPTQAQQPVTNEQYVYNKLYKREDGSYIMKVRAKEVWDMIIKQAHKNAEPGVLFWDNIINESPADCYQEFGFETLGTNPCIVGDTLIAVADGRNAVSIKQLAEEGRDVPVYCLNDKGKIEIQTLRNPRITGYNQPIYEVKFDSGDSIKCTGNHKIRLKDGIYKEAKNLKYGDSIHISSIAYSPIIHKSSRNYRWIKSGDDKTMGKGKSEHRIIFEFNTKTIIPENQVIHHKDFDALNNSFDNLQLMTKWEHNEYHVLGENNPYYRMTDEWKHNFASHPGLTNHTAYQISTDDIIQKGIEYGKELGRRFSRAEWIAYAEKNNLPKFIHPFRGFNGTSAFARYIASKLGFEYNDKDTRLLRRYQDALSNGYNAKITDDNYLIVERTCEECGNKFWTNYDRREYCICSISCSNKYVNKTTDTNIRRTKTINETYKIKGEEKTQAQLKIYSDLKFKLKREPHVKEWEQACINEGVTCRLGTKYGIKNWKEVKELAGSYNHKVISVELCSREDVYNGTVDNYHNYFTVFKPFDNITQSKQFMLNQLNCGEVPLSPWDSCRLGSIVLSSMVKDPYTKNAVVDYKLLSEAARVSQRLMDDIVSLEEEKIEAIITKIKSDSEAPELKQTELAVWQKVKEVLLKGRRTGIGVLGLGDMLAKLGIKYGSKEATELIDKVFETITVNCYRESVQLAKERGCFPIWNVDKESQNPFIIRVISNHFTTQEYNDYLKYGRRNIASMSIAPTGTLAIWLGTTSGIEPVFKIYYKRRRKINPNEPNVKVDFKDKNGDCWQEYNVFHKEFINWFVKDSNESDIPFTYQEALRFLETAEQKDLDLIVKRSPWGGSESHEVDYIEKVNMQGVIQKWIDHSISVTHNLPENVSLEEVNKIYFQAWKAGCKGCTIYREGSRTGVLITKNKEDEDFVPTHAPKRPKELPADYYVVTSSGVKYAVIVGLYKDKPYEIFAFENPPMDKNTRGRTIKVKKGQYKFINGEFEIPDLQLSADRVEQRAHTILLSMLLRHRAPIEHVVNVAKKIDENITSFSSVCRRVLSKYVEASVLDEKCPKCGGNLVREEGCVHCDSCSYSKC